VSAVHWTDEALARLDELHAHIAAEDPAAAAKMIERLLARTRQLPDYPHSGRSVPDYRRAELRELLERPYRIIYRITAERIEIITLKHYRQRLPHRPESLEGRANPD
jgi:plasmid stabilization system protein ParE